MLHVGPTPYECSYINTRWVDCPLIEQDRTPASTPPYIRPDLANHASRPITPETHVNSDSAEPDNQPTSDLQTARWPQLTPDSQMTPDHRQPDDP